VTTPFVMVVTTFVMVVTTLSPVSSTRDECPANTEIWENLAQGYMGCYM